MEGLPRDRRSGHRGALAAPTLPRLLDQALRPAPEGSPTCQRRDQGPGRANGRRESPMARTPDSRRAPQARDRRVRAHGLPPDAQALSTPVPNVAHVSDQPRSGPGPDRVLHRSDHVVVLSERHLCRILTRYFVYYHHSRTHLSLDKNTPDPRPIARPAFGHIIIQIPEVGGLHHRYERRAA